MKRILAIAGAVALAGAIALGSDKDKKEKPEAASPARVTLTADQSKAIELIDTQLRDVQQRAQHDLDVLVAQRNGMLKAWLMGTKLEGKDVQVKKEKDLYVLEEPAPAPAAPAATPSPSPSPSPTTQPAATPTPSPTPVQTPVPPDKKP